jgi:hypothetical protein
MADPTEPKKETVRIAATPLPATKSTEAGDTARITLPTRPPANAPPPIAKPLIPPAPSKPVQAPRFVPPPVPSAAKSNPPISNMAAAPPPITPPPLSPKKETARVAVLPAPAPATVQMKKTQPLIGMPPAAASEVTPVTVAPEMPGIVDKMPIALCWTLVGVSAVILIIQILNYIS